MAREGGDIERNDDIYGGWGNNMGNLKLLDEWGLGQGNKGRVLVIRVLI